MMYKTKESVDNPDKHKRIALHLQYNANNEVSNSITREYHREKIKQTCTRYDYDAFGRRIAKHSEIRQLVVEQDVLNKSQFKQNSKTEYQHTHMLWDGDRPIQEVSDTHVYTTIYDQGSFAPIARAVWLKEGVKLATNDEPDNSYADYNDSYAKPNPKPSDIQVFYYHNDQLGTPNELTNEKGEVVWLADYEAWGNVNKEIWREEKLKPLQIEKEYLQPIRFQGQNFDEETGLHYNRFRYYDPDMGMFIARDPIGLKGGENVFQYAPNPTGWIDPLGLKGVRLTKEEAMNQARGINGDGPLCNFLHIGCSDNHLVCTSATYKREGGSEYTTDFKPTGVDAIPTNVLWPPTPSYVEKYGAICHGARARTFKEEIISFPSNKPNLPPPKKPSSKPESSIDHSELQRRMSSGFGDWIGIHGYGGIP